MSSDFLSCDWGTTSFRLRWISGRERTLIHEIRESAGVKSLHEEAQRRGATIATERAAIFEEFLRRKLETLFANHQAPSCPLPLVISGMASSSIGWRELPYARAPFALDGRGLLVQEIVWNNPAGIETTRLISGVRTEHEMMRGEECEIIGLMSDQTMAELRQRSLLILPGTHCKHVWIENERVIDFRTYMTGELFELLARYSILRASMDLLICTGGLRTDSERSAFTQGVLWAKEHGLPGSLFRVRTRAVLDGAPAHENTWFLSGLLIGTELADVYRSVTDRPIILAATGQLSDLYSLASHTIAGTTTQHIVVPPNKVETALVTAHAVCASALR